MVSDDLFVFWAMVQTIEASNMMSVPKNYKIVSHRPDNRGTYLQSQKIEPLRLAYLPNLNIIYKMQCILINYDIMNDEYVNT